MDRITRITTNTFIAHHPFVFFIIPTTRPNQYDDDFDYEETTEKNKLPVLFTGRLLNITGKWIAHVWILNLLMRWLPVRLLPADSICFE